MNQSTHAQGGHLQNEHRPYWKRAHRDWRFGAATILMLTAMLIYVLTEDFALRPRRQPQKPLPGTLRPDGSPKAQDHADRQARIVYGHTARKHSILVEMGHQPS